LPSGPDAEASGAPEDDPDPVVASATVPASGTWPTPRSPAVPEHAKSTETKAGKKKRTVAIGADTGTLTSSR
jgi:hypothetical protein